MKILDTNVINPGSFDKKVSLQGKFLISQTKQMFCVLKTCLNLNDTVFCAPEKMFELIFNRIFTFSAQNCFI